MSNTALNRTGVSVLTNKSGGPVVQGDVVILDGANSNSFTTTTTASFSDGMVGVVIEPSGIANNGTGLVAFYGYVPKINLSSSASLGDLFKTHTVAGQAVRHAAPAASGDFGQVLGTGTSPAAILWGSPIPPSATGVSVFTDLADVPAAYTGYSGTFVKVNAAENALEFVAPQELDYSEFTTVFYPSGTVEASAALLVGGSAITYDGATNILIEFGCVNARPNVSVGAWIKFWLFEDGLSIGLLSYTSTQTATYGGNVPIFAQRRMKPSAGSHTYSIRVTVSTGTGLVAAGTGGSGNNLPGYLRITKANP